jgi:anti-sigma regulatory factor (Ser/Thr protein kinase)
MKKNIIAIDLRSVPEDSAVLSSLLGDFLDESRAPARAKYDVMISCDEVFSNIYMHAYEKSPDGRIRFSAETGDDCITVTFIDYGRNRMSADQSVGLPADRSSEGGYGLFIINELMDEVHYRRDGAANKITMKKIIRENG